VCGHQRAFNDESLVEDKGGWKGVKSASLLWFFGGKRKRKKGKKNIEKLGGKGIPK